jgi:hypothetical protein
VLRELGGNVAQELTREQAERLAQLRADLTLFAQTATLVELEGVVDFIRTTRFSG